MPLFLCLLLYRLFPYFLFQILISLDPLKKSIPRQSPKNYSRFLISIYLCITTPAFPIDHGREHIPPREKR